MCLIRFTFVFESTTMGAVYLKKSSIGFWNTALLLRRAETLVLDCGSAIFTCAREVVVSASSPRKAREPFSRYSFRLCYRNRRVKKGVSDMKQRILAIDDE